MRRLWDKGTPLDARVLDYTAGEDHALDERLVRLRRARLGRACRDAAGAAAARQPSDLAAICDGLNALAAEHARGAWHVELADEDGQTALERRLTERIGARRRAGAPRALAQRPGARPRCACTCAMRWQRSAAAPMRSPRRSRHSPCAPPTSRCLATPTCSRPCRARWRCGRAASPPRSATTPRVSGRRCGASTRTRSARPPATAPRGCRWTGRPRS